MQLEELLDSVENAPCDLEQIYQRWLDIAEKGAKVQIGIGRLRGPNAMMVLTRAQVLGKYHVPGASQIDQFSINYRRGKGAVLDFKNRSIALSSKAMLQLMLLSISQMHDGQARGVALARSRKAVLIWWVRWFSAAPDELRNQALITCKSLGVELATLLKDAGHGDLAEPWLRWQMSSSQGPELRLEAARRMAELLNDQHRYAEALAEIQHTSREQGRDFYQFTRLALYEYEAYKHLSWHREARDAALRITQRMIASPDPRVLLSYLWQMLRVFLSPGALRNLPAAVSAPWRMLTSPTLQDRVRRTLVKMRYFRKWPLALIPSEPDEKETQRIAVMRLDKLGDLVCMLPAVAQLRQRYPDAKIECFVTKGLESIFEMSPDVDQVYGVPWKSRFSFYRFLRKIKNMYYDLVVDLLEQEKPYEIKLLNAFNAKHKLGFNTYARSRLCDLRAKPPYWRSHVVDQSMWLLKPLGIEPAQGEDRQPHLHLSAEQRQAGLEALREAGVDVENNGQKLVGIHPGSGWRYKRWYPKRFAQVADRLCEQGSLPIIFAGTPKEAHLAQKVRDAMTHTPVMIEPLDLVRFAAAVSHMDLMVVNDSGPMHVCGAVDTPMVVAWGPGDLEMFGPIANNVKLIYDRPDCANCPQEGDPRRCPMGYKYEEVPCLTPITVDKVVGAAESILL